MDRPGSYVSSSFSVNVKINQEKNPSNAASDTPLIGVKPTDISSKESSTTSASPSHTPIHERVISVPSTSPRETQKDPNFDENQQKGLLPSQQDLKKQEKEEETERRPNRQQSRHVPPLTRTKAVYGAAAEKTLHTPRKGSSLLPLSPRTPELSLSKDETQRTPDKKNRQDVSLLTISTPPSSPRGLEANKTKKHIPDFLAKLSPRKKETDEKKNLGSPHKPGFLNFSKLSEEESKKKSKYDQAKYDQEGVKSPRNLKNTLAKLSKGQEYDDFQQNNDIPLSKSQELCLRDFENAVFEEGQFKSHVDIKIVQGLLKKIAAYSDDIFNNLDISSFFKKILSDMDCSYNKDNFLNAFGKLLAPKGNVDNVAEIKNYKEMLETIKYAHSGIKNSRFCPDLSRMDDLVFYIASSVLFVCDDGDNFALEIKSSKFSDQIPPKKERAPLEEKNKPLASHQELSSLSEKESEKPQDFGLQTLERGFVEALADLEFVGDGLDVSPSSLSISTPVSTPTQGVNSSPQAQTLDLNFDFGPLVDDDFEKTSQAVQENSLPSLDPTKDDIFISPFSKNDSSQSE